MEPTFLEQPSFLMALHAVNACVAFAAAIGISSAISMNRGAKVNLAGVMVAVGIILIGLAEANLAFKAMGLPLMPGWDGIKTGAGLLLTLAGVLYGRRLLKKAVR